MTRGPTLNGLYQRPKYEDILRAAVQQPKEGILSVPMQRYATRMINDPMFQRHQEAMSQKLEDQVHRTIEHKTFENHVTTMAMEARINKDDMAFLLSHMGQGPSPPPPPSTREAQSQYEADVNDEETQTDRDEPMTQTRRPPPPPPGGVGIGTQTSRVDRTIETQTDRDETPMMGSRVPPPAPAGVPIIRQTSPQLVEQARAQAEFDGLAQEQAKRAAIPRLQQQIETLMEQQKATPHAALIKAAEQLREVPTAPLQPAEDAYVAPAVRQPTVRASPYDQYHGPVAPGIRERGQIFTGGQAASSELVPVPPKPKQPTLAQMSDSDKRGGGGGGGAGKKIRIASEEIVKPKAKAAPAQMSDADKRGGPGGGGAGKKIRIAEEELVKPSKRKPDAEKEEAPPLKTRPKPSRAPVFPSKIKPSKAPEPAASGFKHVPRPSKAPLAIEDETGQQSFERKFVGVGKTQGKFVKTRRAPRVGPVVNIAAQPSQPLDGDHEMVPSRPWVAQGRQMLSSGMADLREKARLRMAQVMAQLRSTVAATPTGQVMSLMLEQARRNRRGNAKGFKGLGNNRRGGPRR